MRVAGIRFATIATIASIALTFAMAAKAGTAYYWDPSGTLGSTTGGAGTWDTTSYSWWTGAGSATWPNTTAYDAGFGGAGSAVTVSGNLSAGSLNLAASDYSFSGGTLSLAGGIGTSYASGSCAISGRVALQAAQTWSVDSGGSLFVGTLSGSAAMTKIGAGTLTVGPTDSVTTNTSYSGSITISDGWVAACFNSGSGSPVGTLGTGTIIMAGGTLTKSSASVGERICNDIFAKEGTNSYIGSFDSSLGSVRLYSNNSVTGTGTLTLVNKSTNAYWLSNTAYTNFEGTFVLQESGGYFYTTGTPTTDKATWVIDARYRSQAASGTVSFGALSCTNSAGTIDDQSSGTVTYRIGALNANTTYAGVIHDKDFGTSGSTRINLLKVGTGMLTLTGMNAYGGTNTSVAATTISGGTLCVGDGSTNGSITGAIVDNACLAINRSDVYTIGYDLTGSGTLCHIGSGTLQISSGNLSGPILGSSPLEKVGTGTMILSGVSSFSGPTTVSAGILRLSGSMAGSNVAVNGGSLALAGGTIGSVSVASGASLDGYGTAGAVSVSSGGAIGSSTDSTLWGGQLTVPTLAFAGAGSVNVGNVANYASNAAIVVTQSGGLTWGSMINLNLCGTVSAGSGTATVIQYSGAVTGALNCTVSASFINLRSSVSLNTATAGYVRVDYFYDRPYWTGLAGDGGIWSTGTATGARNWALASSGSSTDYIENDDVLFDDRANTATATVTLGQTVNPKSVVFDNSGTVSYTITAGTNAYEISGSCALAKYNSGTATILSNNSYTGATTVYGGELILAGTNSSSAITISAGTLQIGTGGTVGSIVSNVVDNGTLAFNRSGTCTYSGVISGSGSVVNLGSGRMILSGASTYTGGTLLKAGRLSLANAAALGTGTITLSGGTLAMDISMSTNSLTITNPIYVAGTTNTRLVNNGLANLYVDGNMTGNGTVTFANGGGAFLYIRGNNSNFAGTAVVNSSLTLVPDGNNPGSPNAAYLVSGTVRNWAGDSSGGTMQMGYLWGGGNLDNSSTGNHTYSIGALNGSSVFSGRISDYANAIHATYITSVIKVGTGTLTLTSTTTGGNNFTGGLTISNGALQIGNGSTGGYLGLCNVVNNSLLVFNRSNEYSFSYNISGTGSVNHIGGGTITLSGTNTYSGGTNILGTGTFQIGDGANTGTALAGTINTGSAGRLLLNAASGGTISLTKAIYGSGTVTSVGPGAVILSADNTYTGPTNVYAGTMTVSGGNSSTSVTVDGGTLEIGNGGATGVIASDINTSGTGSGTVVFNRSNVYYYDYVISGSGSVVHNGSGTTNLSQTHTYTGATTVNLGTLRISSSISSSSGISVTGSSATLALAGGSVGNVWVAMYGSLVGYGTAGSIGTDWYSQIGSATDAGTWGQQLTVGSLSLSGYDYLHFGNIGNYASNAAITVTASGGFAASHDMYVSLSGTLPAGTGTARLIRYSGGIVTESSPNYQLSTTFGTNSRMSFSVSTTSSSGYNYVTVSYTYDYPYWTGLAGNGGIWSTSSTGGSTNWKLASNNSQTNYLDNDAVLFSDAGSASTAVTLGQDVTPDSVRFDNSAAVNYTITSGTDSYGIVGTATLTKYGAGTVTILNANSYTGETTIYAGALNLQNSLALGTASAVTVQAGGTLQVQGSISVANNVTLSGTLQNVSGANTCTGAVTLAGAGTVSVASDGIGLTGVVSGTGSLCKTGSGTVTLSGANSYTGGTTLLDGTLVTTNSYSLGKRTNTLTLSGGTLAGASTGTNYIGGYSSTESGAVNVVAGKSITYTSTGTTGTDFWGNLTGSGTLTINTPVSGTFWLRGTNTSFDGTLYVVSCGSVNYGMQLRYSYVGGTGTTWVLNGDYARIQTYANLETTYPSAAGTITLGALAGTNSNAIISLNQAGGSITSVTYAIGAKNLSTEYAGHIYDQMIEGTVSGAGGTASKPVAVAKVGTGTLTLSGENAYTGGTMIYGGMLQIGKGAASGTVIGNVNTGDVTNGTGTLAFNRSDAYEFSGAIGGAGDVAQVGSGTTTLSGANTYTGTTYVKKGVLVIQGDAARANLLDAVGCTDIGTGKLVFSYSGSAIGNTISDQIKSILTASYNGGTNSWTSGTICSTLANSHSTDSYALGWSNNTATSEVTVKVVLYGDATMDGTVNIYDLGQVLANYNKSGVWATGDFNYDGTVNIYDLGTVLANYNKSLSLSELSVDPSDYAGLDGQGVAALQAAGVNVVPEPGTLALLTAAAVGAIAYTSRRRRERKD
jgi:fibronectin-binding autotransporter adhesin